MKVTIGRSGFVGLMRTASGETGPAFYGRAVFTARVVSTEIGNTPASLRRSITASWRVTCSIQQKLRGGVQVGDDLSGEPGGVRPIDNPVMERQTDRQQ